MKKGSSKKAKPAKPKAKKPLKAFKKTIKKTITGQIRKLRRKIGLTRSKPVRKTVSAVRAAPRTSKKLLPVPVVPPALAPAPVPVYVPIEKSSFELPAQYGDNKVALFARDPWWVYCYWEVTPDRERETLEWMRREGCRRDKTVLRVYDVTGSSVEKPRSFFDIEIAFLASNWYIDVGIPDRDWVVEIGLRSGDGRFFPMARSNTVRTPRFGVSDVLDEEWLLPEELYWKLFGLSGGLADRRSSLDVREILEKYLRSIVSSEGMSSFSQSSKMLRNESRMDVSAKILGSS